MVDVRITLLPLTHRRTYIVHRATSFFIRRLVHCKNIRTSTDILWFRIRLQCGPALRHSVDLRTQTYTEPVPLKYGKLATKYPSMYEYFYSVESYLQPAPSVNVHRLFNFIFERSYAKTRLDHILDGYVQFTPAQTYILVIFIIGPIPWGHSGPLCHALSLSSLWTSHAACAIAIAGVRLATPGD